MGAQTWQIVQLPYKDSKAESIKIAQQIISEVP